ncbi:hypothetical protein [Aliagarivorans taiwanensis]|uniref:hypothetical protein n=1 Tax=Aliagarivorans taiwanensis TaxID=561966 RepID=UPI00041F9ACB|nr:hypothetical protein [Aliagarivorans taiwanensis]
MSELAKAHFVADVTVTDPDTQAPVDVAIYKDQQSGAMFGVDCSYLMLLAEDDPVFSPFNEQQLILVEPKEGEECVLQR